MYCSNCGKEINESANFCQSCGATIGGNIEKKQEQSLGSKILEKSIEIGQTVLNEYIQDSFSNEDDSIEENVNDNITTNDNVKVEEINSIPELKNFFEEMQEKQGETALRYALQAQLQVLQVVQSPSLNESVFDLLLHYLDKAIEISENESQKKIIQENAAIMVNSMIFFMEAKIQFEKDKWTNEGLDLLKQGCNTLVDSAVPIVNLIKSKGATIAVDGIKLFNTLTQDRTFINRLIDYFSGSQEQKIAQMKKDLNIFMLSALDKLDKYKRLFGKSLILAELFERNSQIIINSKINNIKNKSEKLIKPKKPSKPEKPNASDYLFSIAENPDYDDLEDWDSNKPTHIPVTGIHLYDGLNNKTMKTIGITLGIEIIILVLLLIILGIMKLFNLIPVIDGKNTINNFWIFIKWGSLIIPASIISILFLKLIGNIQYNNKLNRANELVEEEMSNYEKELETYESKIEEYENKLKSYNIEVEKYNEEYKNECKQTESHYQSVINYFRYGS